MELQVVGEMALNGCGSLWCCEVGEVMSVEIDRECFKVLSECAAKGPVKRQFLRFREKRGLGAHHDPQH